MKVDLMTPEGNVGELATYIQNNKLQIGNMRPFIGEDGKAYMTVHTGGDQANVENYATVQANSATLRRDEWKQLDEVVQLVQLERLTGIGDLEAKGLVYNLRNPMGTTVLEYSEMTGTATVEMSMDGVSRAKNDRPGYTPKYLPIPIIHGDYEINARELATSRNMGNGLDTTQAENEARAINVHLEKMLFTDTKFIKGGGTIWSYINHEDRNLQTLSMDWDNASKTPALILADVLDMKAKMIADHFYGPYYIYIPTAYETVMDEDYVNSVAGTQTGATSDTLRARILKIENIEAVKVVDSLPANNVVMVQLTSNVVRLVKGFGLQNVEWKSEGNMVTNYKVMTIQVPQIRSSASGQCGIVHLSA